MRHFISSEITQNAEFDAEYLENAASLLNDTYTYSRKLSVATSGVLAF